MHKPFDVTTKQIVDRDPLAWVRFLGLPADSATLLDTDIAVLAQPDRLIRASCGGSESISHSELQSSYDRYKIDDAHFYHVWAKREYRLPVDTTFVLLRKEAFGPTMESPYVDGNTILSFNIIRVWEIEPEVFLDGALSTLPLAVTANVTEESLPNVVNHMKDRLQQEGAGVDEGAFWLETFVLLGLNYTADFSQAMLAGVRNMRESSTYQMILKEGEEQGIALGEARGIALGEARGITLGQELGRAAAARDIILRAGTKRFGEPDDATRAVIAGTDSVDRLESLAVGLFDVESWSDLLGD